MQLPLLRPPLVTLALLIHCRQSEGPGRRVRNRGEDGRHRPRMEGRRHGSSPGRWSGGRHGHHGGGDRWRGHNNWRSTCQRSSKTVERRFPRESKGGPQLPQTCRFLQRKGRVGYHLLPHGSRIDSRTRRGQHRGVGDGRVSASPTPPRGG